MTTQVTHLVPLADRPLRERVAANVRAELARYGLHQATVAQAMGVTPAAVSLKLSGKRPLTIDDLEAIAPLVYSTPEELLAGANTNPRPGGGPGGGDSVRHQGLEPRTRWFGASRRSDGWAEVIPLPVREEEGPCRTSPEPAEVIPLRLTRSAAA